MADLLDPNVKVQYRIKQNTSKGEFNDALYFTKADFEALDDADLQAQVDKRVTDWIAFVTEQSTRIPVEPTRAELQARKAELELELEKVNDKLR